MEHLVIQQVQSDNELEKKATAITLALSKRGLTAAYEAWYIHPQADKGESDYILNELGVESLKELMDLIVEEEEDLTLKEEA